MVTGAERGKPVGLPPENIALLERYTAWRLDGGASENTTLIIYLPMAGHVLGLALNPTPNYPAHEPLAILPGADAGRSR